MPLTYSILFPTHPHLEKLRVCSTYGGKPGSCADCGWLESPWLSHTRSVRLLSSVSVLRSWLRRNKTSAVIWSNSRFPVFPGSSLKPLNLLPCITGRVATGNLLYLVKQELNKNRLRKVKLKSIGDCIFCCESVGSNACSVLQLCAAFSHPAATRKVLSQAGIWQYGLVMLWSSSASVSVDALHCKAIKQVRAF